MQRIKKDIKFLEGSYEGLEFIQEDCRDQSIAKRKRVQEDQNDVAHVKEICQRQDDIAQTKQVLQTGKICYYYPHYGVVGSVGELTCLVSWIFVLQELLQYTKKIVKVAQEIVLNLVDEELPAWKRRQQLACVGSPVDASLHHLQNWYEQVVS